MISEELQKDVDSMLNPSLEKLMGKEQIFTKMIKEQKELIKERTADIQKILKRNKEERASLRRKIKHKKREVMLDKSVHILDRFSLWVFYEGKKEEQYIIKDGPARQRLFHYCERHQAIDVIEHVEYMMEDLAGDLKDNHYIDIQKVTKKDKELFDELREKERQELVAVMENLIDLNVGSFTFDW